MSETEPARTGKRTIKRTLSDLARLSPVNLVIHGDECKQMYYMSHKLKKYQILFDVWLERLACLHLLSLVLLLITTATRTRTLQAFSTEQKQQTSRQKCFSRIW